MRVYEVVCLVDEYQSFIVVDEELNNEVLVNAEAMLRFDGRRKEAKWKPPQVKIYKPRLKQGDFFDFIVGSFVVSPETWDKAAMFLEMAGELLPLPYEGEEFAVLNVTECIECLDDQKSEWVKTSYGRRLRKAAFNPSLFGESSIFKIPYSPGRIYCYEASGDTETEFKAFVEQEKMTGLSFRKVWSDEK